MQKKKWIVLILTICVAVVSTSCEHKKEKDNKYTITQYGDYERLAHMFYTIEDSDNNLIIIDGGWDYDSDLVREIIAQHNNHVCAWIITHPHPDHTGAFNVIASNLDGIIIDDIYTVDVDYDRYAETAQWYDVYEACELYRSLIESMDNVHKMNENDSFSCLGLDFKVIHAWDDNVSKMSIGLCNNGSMCFIVSGKEDKMLFMADSQVEIQDDILDRHMDELDVDYIQLGHHGNWGPTTEFYDNLNPKAVFFDSSRFVFEEEGYTASDLKVYFEERGIETYTFLTQPNSIEFK